jgi:hypothetical protein
MKRIKDAFKYGKEVELIQDNCPTTFDFTESGMIPIKKVKKSFKVMETVKKVQK